jgi:hypothetical protein
MNRFHVPHDKRGPSPGRVLPSARSPVPSIRETTMKNPLDSLWGTVLCGLVLTAVLYYLARAMMAGG